MYPRERVLASETAFQMHSQFQCSKLRLKSLYNYKPCTSAACKSEFNQGTEFFS